MIGICLTTFLKCGKSMRIEVYDKEFFFKLLEELIRELEIC